MKKQNTLEHSLNSTKPSLTEAQRSMLWSRIETDITHAQPIPSPFSFTHFITIKPMAPLALAVLLMLSVGGTAAASNAARPGDLLFPIDQVIEDVRLSLANNDEARARLQIAFAEERLAELRSILDEDEANDTDDDSTDTGTTTASVTATTTLEAEADVFTDTTIVKVGINNRKTTFETAADTREEVIAEIATRFNVSEATVAAALDFEVEDRASLPQDGANGSFSDETRVRVGTSVSLIAKLLGDNHVDADARARILAELLTELHGEDTRARGDTDETRLEVRDGGSRIEIREKNGETKLEIKNDDDSDSRNDSDTEDDDATSGSSFEAEADVFTDTTIIKVELNDRKTTFETAADTREEVIAEIATRFNVSEATVAAALDFEVEDRANRTTDENDEDARDDDSSQDDSNDSDDTETKIEVRVEGLTAEVRMEYDGTRDEFSTIYTTRTALIAQLALRSGLTEATIGSALDLEIKE